MNDCYNCIYYKGRGEGRCTVLCASLAKAIEWAMLDERAEEGDVEILPDSYFALDCCEGVYV